MTDAVNPIPPGMHTVTPHLVCAGAAEAIEFYKKAFNAVEVGRMPAPDGKLMHASLRIGDSTVMASDCHSQGKPNFEGISLSISAANDAQAERAFAALSGNGGKVCAPLTKTFFSSKFGVATDRFGVTWMIVVMP